MEKNKTSRIKAYIVSTNSFLKQMIIHHLQKQNIVAKNVFFLIFPSIFTKSRSWSEFRKNRRFYEKWRIQCLFSQMLTRNRDKNDLIFIKDVSSLLTLYLSVWENNSERHLQECQIAKPAILSAKTAMYQLLCCNESYTMWFW